MNLSSTSLRHWQHELLILCLLSIILFQLITIISLMLFLLTIVACNILIWVFIIELDLILLILMCDCWETTFLVWTLCCCMLFTCISLAIHIWFRWSFCESVLLSDQFFLSLISCNYLFSTHDNLIFTHDFSMYISIKSV